MLPSRSVLRAVDEFLTLLLFLLIKKSLFFGAKENGIDKLAVQRQRGCIEQIYTQLAPRSLPFLER